MQLDTGCKSFLREGAHRTQNSRLQTKPFRGKQNDGLIYNIITDIGYKKCKVIHFGSRNIKYDYEMNGIKLDKSTCERDLGIKIDQTLKPSNQCAEAVRKAKVSLNSISRAFHYRDKKIFLRLYYQYVRSHLEYSTPAWSPWNIADCQSLEKVQEKAINMISGLKGETYEEKLKELLPDLKDFKIERFELSNINSLNFYIHGILEDGVSSNNRKEKKVQN